MPIQTLSVRVRCVYVMDDADFWGAGEWHLHATVDGNQLGNPDTEFSVHSGDLLLLPTEDWTRVVDVSSHAAGSSVNFRFHVMEHDVFSNDNLGEVQATVNYPYDDPYNLFIYLEGPIRPGGLFSSDHRCYAIMIGISPVDEVANPTGGGSSRIPVTRTSHGGAIFNTVRGETFTPRVDIHPVIPVPGFPSHVPRPVWIPNALAPAQNTPAAQVTTAPTAPSLNALPNASLIPIISATDPDFNNRVANIAITAFEPGDLDPAKFFWKVASGTAVIDGPDTGLTIRARGTGAGGADQMAVFEIHWENDSGPLLATYRAWVGKTGTLKYRVNRLNGMNPPTAPAGTSPPFPVNILMPDATIQAIMAVVKAILFQAGIVLIPDDDTTCWEGAVWSSDAIFDVTVTDNNHTNNVSHEVVSAATRYNFRPGVINFAIVFSTGPGNAAAVDRNGIEGNPDSPKSMGDGNRYTFSGNGVEKKLGGSPSNSWIKPSGVGRDGAATEQKMKTIQPTDRCKQAKRFDQAFVAARQAADPAFSGEKMRELYAAQVPAQWCLNVATITPSATPGAAIGNYVWNCGINFAHELCHVLGLAHRGSGGNSTGPSADGMDFTDASGTQRGHPWNENIMTYGYVKMSPPLAHDIDLLQAMVIRKHPAIHY